MKRIMCILAMSMNSFDKVLLTCTISTIMPVTMILYVRNQSCYCRQLADKGQRSFSQRSFIIHFGMPFLQVRIDLFFPSQATLVGISRDREALVRLQTQQVIAGEGQL